MPVVVNLSVVGKDRTGVVARITSHLFEAGANIEALEERVRRGTFHMNLQATWGKGFDPKAERRALARIGKELGMEIRMRVHEPGAKRKAAILLTKEPHAFEAVMKAIRGRKLALDPVIALSNRKDLQGLAEKHDIPFHYVPWTNTERAETRVLKLLDAADVDLLVLARFMRILSPTFVWRYPNRIVNVHPSLLPAFPGASAYRQAWEHGVRVVGATAHFVTPDLDQGPILAQKAVPVARGEALDAMRRRGQECESEVLVEGLQLCLQEDLDVHWGRVW